MKQVLAILEGQHNSKYFVDKCYFSHFISLY